MFRGALVSNPSCKALSVALLAEVASVIVCFALEQSTSAQPVRALICELHLDGLYRLEFVFQLIASLSLIRKGLSGLGDHHRLSDVAKVASTLRKLDASMCEVLQWGLKCLMALLLWSIDDDPFWRCGISFSSSRMYIIQTHLFGLSMVRLCLRRMFDGMDAGVILKILN